MLYLIHHPPPGKAVDLRGESSKDVIACRWECSLADMIALANRLRIARQQLYGLETATLYISERGRTVVYRDPEPIEGRA